MISRHRTSLTLENEHQMARDGLVQRSDPSLTIGREHSPREFIRGVRPELVQLQPRHQLPLST